MSWFNFYIKHRAIKEMLYNPKTDRYEQTTVGYEEYFDKDDYDYWQRWEYNARENRGKNVKFYDDITLEEISAVEIRKMENTITGDENYVYIPIVDQDLEIEVLPTAKQIHHYKRKYKSRLPISTDLRRAVYQLFDRACRSCGNREANQIHHIDGDPSNNHIKNLELLCYDCHLIVEGKIHYHKKLNQD